MKIITRIKLTPHEQYQIVEVPEDFETLSVVTDEIYDEKGSVFVFAPVLYVIGTAGAALKTIGIRCIPLDTPFDEVGLFFMGRIQVGSIAYCIFEELEQ